MTEFAKVVSRVRFEDALNKFHPVDRFTESFALILMNEGIILILVSISFAKAFPFAMSLSRYGHIPCIKLSIISVTFQIVEGRPNKQRREPLTSLADRWLPFTLYSRPAWPTRTTPVLKVERDHPYLSKTIYVEYGYDNFLRILRSCKSYSSLSTTERRLSTRFRKEVARKVIHDS